MDGDAKQPQRKQHQPNHWKKDEGKQGQRPAEHQENAPANEQNESLHLAFEDYKFDATTQEEGKPGAPHCPAAVRRIGEGLYFCPE